MNPNQIVLVQLITGLKKYIYIIYGFSYQMDEISLLKWVQSQNAEDSLDTH